MKLQVLSDIHNEFGRFSPPDVDADVTIFGGDIDTEADGVAWAIETFKQRPVVYVPGNHEYYSRRKTVQKINAEMKAIAAGSNVHVLLDETLVVGGVRILGGTLWTDFRLFGNPILSAEIARAGMQDYNFSRVEDMNAERNGVRRMRPADTYAWHCATRAFIERETAKPWTGKTIVVTHHAPCARAVPPQFRVDPISPCFASELEYLMGSNIDLWIYGHTHDTRDFQLNGTRLVCNQRGYAPHMLVETFDEWLTIEV